MATQRIFSKENRLRRRMVVAWNKKRICWAVRLCRVLERIVLSRTPSVVAQMEQERGLTS